MQKKETVRFVYFLAFTFLALAVFGGLGFYNGYNAITGAAFEVNPFEGLLSGFESLFQNNEYVGYILVFIAIFPIIYLSVSRVHIFKVDNKSPRVLVAVSLTLISMIFVPSFTETIIGIFVYSTFLTLLIVILLLAWTAYSLLHKQVSEDVGEFAEVASQRNDKRASLFEAKAKLTNAKIPKVTADSDLKIQKNMLSLKTKLQDKSSKMDKQLKYLNFLAVKKGKGADPNVINELNGLDNDIRLFKGHIASSKFDDANNLYTSISANLGKVESLIKK